MNREDFMHEAVAIANESVRNGGGPFGAVIVCNGKIIARGSNSVTLLNDPTAHAEISAIREACRREQTFKLEGCELYTSCEPCPMCLGAAYWAGIGTIYYGCTRADAAAAGFDDEFIYGQIGLDPAARTIPAIGMPTSEACEAFHLWHENEDKVRY